MVTILDGRTEEEIEKYRNERIQQFVWLAKNIKYVIDSIDSEGDPDGLKTMLLEKLRQELREFAKE